jgi:hypothetical protein
MASIAAPLISGIAGSVAAGATGWVGALAEVAKPLIELIPNEKDKLAAQAHIADAQLNLSLAQIDQQNKIIAAASTNIGNDPHMSWVRAFFCFSMSLVYVWNYALCRVVGHTAMDFPNQLHWMFAALMLGLIGIPSVLDTFKSIMSLPGESQASVLGVRVGNKS